MYFVVCMGVLTGTILRIIYLVFFQDPEQICYDLKYALRLCMEHDRKKACVHIYSLMGLYEEAVDLALDVSL